MENQKLIAEELGSYLAKNIVLGPSKHGALSLNICDFRSES